MTRWSLNRSNLPAVLALTALAAPAWAETGQFTRATAPVYDSVVVFALPGGFEPGFEHAQNGSYILELVPQGQSVEAWQEMLTLTGVDNAQQNAGMSAKEIVDWGLEEMARGYEAGCAHPVTFEAFNDAPPPGAEDAVLAYVGCAELRQTGQSEQMMFWLAVREGDLFTLQWAERGTAVEALAFDPPHWFARFDLLKAMSLCGPAPGEEAPYPSCLD